MARPASSRTGAAAFQLAWRQQTVGLTAGGREDRMATEPRKRDASFDEVLAAGELAEDKRKQGRGADRGGGGRHQSARRLARQGRRRLRRRSSPSFHLYAAAAGSPPFSWTPIIPDLHAAAPARRHGAGADLRAVSDVRAAGAIASRRSTGCAPPPASASSPTFCTRGRSSAIAPSTPSRSISTSASS